MLHFLMLLFTTLVVLLAVILGIWMLLTRQGRQAVSVTAVGISTLKQRLGMSSVIVVGIAGVVAVLVALLAMGDGYSETLRKTGSADTAIVMRGASASEVMSVLDRGSVTLIPQAPGIAKDAKGAPIASPELVVAANLPIKGGAPDDDGSVQLRGVGEQAWAVRPQLKIIEGRNFKPGMRELIAGKGAATQCLSQGIKFALAVSCGPWSACSPPAMRWIRKYGAMLRWWRIPIDAAVAGHRSRCASIIRRRSTRSKPHCWRTRSFKWM